MEAPAKRSDTSMRGRATENLAALNIFLDHPMLGVGPGQTQMYTAKYGDEEGITRLQGNAAGSQYVSWRTCGYRRHRFPEPNAHFHILSRRSDESAAAIFRNSAGVGGISHRAHLVACRFLVKRSVPERGLRTILLADCCLGAQLPFKLQRAKKKTRSLNPPWYSLCILALEAIVNLSLQSEVEGVELEAPVVRSESSRQFSDLDLQLCRRLDWRFLLPNSDLGNVAYLGREKTSLAAALARFSRSLSIVSSGKSARIANVQASKFDLVVVSLPTLSNFSYARESP